MPIFCRKVILTSPLKHTRSQINRGNLNLPTEQIQTAACMLSWIFKWRPWDSKALLTWSFVRRFEPSWEGSSNRRNLLRRFMWIDPKLIFQYTESKWIVSSISHLIETYLYHFTNFARWCVYPVYYLSQIQIVWLSGFLDMLHFKKTDTDMLNLTTCQWSPGCHSRRFFGRSHCLACIF